jgi:predicted RNase H-like nuclease (RuvC/YqgF family)
METNDNIERLKTIFTDNKAVIIGILIGLILGGGFSSIYMNNKMSRAMTILNEEISYKEDELDSKNGRIDDLEADILELESMIQQKKNQISTLEDTVDDLTGSQSANTEQIDALEDYIQDLEDQVFELESSIMQKNDLIDVLEDTVEELEEALSDYEDRINVTMLATGTEWESSDDYDLESSFTMGYSDDFMVIYEIENMLHSKIYQLAVDIYIISGGVIHDSVHRSSFGTLPDGDSSQGFYDEFDISGLEHGYYTVVLTATDLITGDSCSRTYDFEVTLK